MPSTEILIGVSTCLLGEQVRYDGGHKRDHFINDVLADFVTFVPVCPEVDIGLGTPREAIHLIDRDGAIRLVGAKSGDDHTTAMRRYCRTKVRKLQAMNLSGYILKKNSPSCGMERVRVREPGRVRKDGRGLFAEALIRACPELPVEEEGRLHDPRLRENFLERVFAYRRAQTLFSGRWTVGDLVRFHTAAKLQVLAHDPVRYRELGRLVAAARSRPRRDVAATYLKTFMAAMSRIATVRKQCNVLQHIQGHFKRNASLDDRRELEGLIEDYRRELVPLIVPITLIRHLVRRYGVEYLRGQTYLEPNPKELMLRNHV